MLKTKLLISFFSVSFLAFAGSELEARPHSHFNLEVNIGSTPAYSVYPSYPAYVMPAPAAVVMPSRSVVVQTAPVAAVPSRVAPFSPHCATVPTPTYATPTYATQTYATPTYIAPAYVVPAQPIAPVVVSRPNPRTTWGFNWGFFFR